MISGSVSPLVLRTIRPAGPASVSSRIDVTRAERVESGRHHQPAEPRACVPGAGEKVEQLAHVGADIGVRGEQTHVLVDPSGRGVVVAASDVAVAADVVALSPDHQRDLRVGLEPHESVDDLHPRLFERPRPARLACSSNRAWSSTTAVTCLPDCEARTSESTVALSSPVR